MAGLDVLELARRHSALLQDRQSWEADWKSLAKHFLPRKCRVLEYDPNATNVGGLRTDVIDSTGVYAMRDLAAGLHGGMTSPARPWFRLGLQDETLERKQAVREFLDEVQNRMRTLLHRSNFYNAVHQLYAELGTFGTGFMFVMPDERTGIRFAPLTVGEYVLDTDENGRVDTIFRVLDFSARQLVRRFGYDKLPPVVQAEYDKPAITQTARYRVVHGVFPRNDREPGKRDGRNKPFASVYWLDRSNGSAALGSGNAYHKLSEGGFDQFPGFGPRWDVTGQDVYGRSPGMDALADCRMVQQMKITALKAMHKEVDPPVGIQGQLKGALDLLPGGQNIVDTTGNGPGVYPITKIQPNLQNTMFAIKEVQQAIKDGLFNTLFRMLMNSDRRQITAKEVAAREEEKLILIGPVLERLHDELFIPLIDRVFEIMIAEDMLPPWPEEIAGMPIKVEFVSLLAQAQKMVATSSVDQFMGFIGTYAQFFPDLLDIPNPDKLGDGYAAYLGSRPICCVRRRPGGTARRAKKQQDMWPRRRPSRTPRAWPGRPGR